MDKFIFRTIQGNIETHIKDNVVYFLNFTEDKVTDVPKKYEWLVIRVHNYFNGCDDLRDIEVHLDGTNFQVKAWKALMKIPYGEVISYKEQARLIGNEKACRAVGSANSKNKIALIVP